MNLSEWLTLCNSFAVLVPLTGTEDNARYLGRLEESVSVEDMVNKRFRNGCCIDWSKVPDAGIYYCLCADHSLHGICLHMVLWLVSQGIVLPPPKWSAVHVTRKDRTQHWVDGSALLREQPASQYATNRVVKGLMDRDLPIR